MKFVDTAGRVDRFRKKYGERLRSRQEGWPETPTPPRRNVALRTVSSHDLLSGRSWGSTHPVHHHLARGGPCRQGEVVRAPGAWVTSEPRSDLLRDDLNLPGCHNTVAVAAT